MRLDRAEELITVSDRRAVADARRPARSSRPGRSAGGRSRSATSTSWPRPTGRRPLIDAFTSFGLVDSVINRGGYKAAVQLLRGPQVDLMVMPPGEAGTYRIHFTGLEGAQRPPPRDGARPGWSLSEKGFLRIGEDGEPLTGDAAELRTFAIRGRGVRLPRPAVHRAGAARGQPARSRPRSPAGCRGSSTWPTCAATCTPTPTGPTGTTRSRSWPSTARRRGYAYQVLTDHTQSLTIARGLTPDRVAEQARSSPR